MISSPGVELVTSEGLLRLEVTLKPGLSDRMPDVYLHHGTADIQDTFHRFKISKLYSSFFGLPPVRDSDVGRSDLEYVSPCLTRLPMGHTWSLHLLRERR